MGASEFLNRRLNEEFQRAFEAGIPSSALYPSPEMYHIGTPSDRTTSEGFRSALLGRTCLWRTVSDSISGAENCTVARRSPAHWPVMSEGSRHVLNHLLYQILA